MFEKRLVKLYKRGSVTKIEVENSVIFWFIFEQNWMVKYFDWVLGQDIWHRAGRGGKVTSAHSGQTLG